MTRLPLDGVRVLDLSRLLPGPFCTLILAQLGADVVKVEDTGGGDYMRLIPPLKQGMGGAYYALNQGKRSICLDLKQPAGRELLLRLVADARVVLESFRPGVLQRLGLSYEELCQANPEVILCSISGYGQDGPLKGRAGHDINYLALSGVLAAGGQRDGEPALPGVQISDLAGGSMWAAIRILAALYSGQGGHLDVSMTEGALGLMLPWFGEMAFSGAPLRRGAATLSGGAARYNPYPTGDGYLAVGSLEPKFWAGLCTALGLPCDLSEADDQPRQQQIAAQLKDKLASQSRDQWAEQLAPADVCVEPVLEMDEVPDHPQHRHRGAFHQVQDPDRGPLTLPRLPLDVPPGHEPAPSQGQHTDEILSQLGLDTAELARLRDSKVIR